MSCIGIFDIFDSLEAAHLYYKNRMVNGNRWKEACGRRVKRRLHCFNVITYRSVLNHTVGDRAIHDTYVVFATNPFKNEAPSSFLRFVIRVCTTSAILFLNRHSDSARPPFSRRSIYRKTPISLAFVRSCPQASHRTATKPNIGKTPAAEAETPAKPFSDMMRTGTTLGTLFRYTSRKKRCGNHKFLEIPEQQLRESLRCGAIFC